MQTAQLEEKLNTESCPVDVYCFVCAGNTCRSPMAEAVFNAKYKNERRAATSAGLSYGGMPIAKNAEAALRAAKIEPSEDNDYPNHISRTLTSDLLKTSKAIVAMTSDIAMKIICMFPEYASKVFAMPRDISDPFGADEARYAECLQEIQDCLNEVFGEAGKL